MNISNAQEISFSAQSKKPKKVKNKGKFAGFMATEAVLSLALPVQYGTLKLLKSSDSFTPKGRERAMRGLDRALKISHLSNAGVEIIKVKDGSKKYKELLNVAAEAIKTKIYGNLVLYLEKFKFFEPENKRAVVELRQSFMSQIMKSMLPNFSHDSLVQPKDAQLLNKLKKTVIKPIATVLSGIMVATTELGINAMALPELKKIIIPKDKLSGAGYHELGHMQIEYFSKYGKKLQDIARKKSLAKFVPIIFLLSLFTKNKKQTEDKKLNPWNKFTNFVRNNAGKLTFLTAVPLLTVEALATHKGNKLAKEVLSETLYRKVAKSNRTAFLSYLAQALITSLSIFAGVKVKDKIQAKHEKKVQVYNDKLNPPKKEKVQAKTELKIKEKSAVFKDFSI